MFIFLGSLLLNGAEFKSNSVVEIGAGDSTNADLFAAARLVSVLGAVHGDLFVGAQRVTLNGTVDDDVIAWCEEVEINGQVNDMLLSFGRIIRVKGEIFGDMLAYGAEVYIEPGAVVHGNLYVGAGKVVLNEGTITGGIKGGAGKAILNGNVGGDINMYLDFIKFDESFAGAGETVLHVHEEQLDEKVVNAPANVVYEFIEPEYFYTSGFFYFFLLSVLITGILYVAIFRNFSRDLAEFSNRNFWRNIGVGALTLIGIPVVCVIMIVTIITIPLSFSLLSVYFILLYWSVVISGIFAGRWLLGLIRKEDKNINSFLAAIAGIILLVLVTKIPVIGGIILFMTFAFGFGSLVNYLWDYRKNKMAQA